MSEILGIFVPWVAYVAMTFAFLRWDEARLTPAVLARAWPPSSRAIAVVYFTLLAVPIHFVRTRRSLLGGVKGVLWGLVFIALDDVVGFGVETIVNRYFSS